MKKILFLLIALIAFAITIYSYGAEGVISVSSAGNNALTIQNADNIIFSPKGDKLAILNKTSFVVIDADYEVVKKFKGSSEKQTYGNFVCFLPDGSVVYNCEAKTFKIQPGEEIGEQVLSEEIEGGDSESKAAVVFDNDIIYSGDGSYDWGGKKGNVIKYNLRKGLVTRKCQINGYWYAQLSASKKYILYQYGSEENNNAYFYDIIKDKNYSVSDYFAFNRALKSGTDEEPIIWIKNKDAFICGASAYEEGKSHFLSESENWLVCCDIKSKKILWKVADKLSYFPDDWVQINEKEALIRSGDTVYVMSVDNGMVKECNWINGARKLSVSQDGKKIAYIKKNTLFVGNMFSVNFRKVFTFSKDFIEQYSYKGMGTHCPVWSPDGKMIFYLGQFETKVIKLL